MAKSSELKTPTIGQWQFDNQALSQMVSRYKVKIYQLMAANNQTNSSTARGWMKGGEMITRSIVNTCTYLRFDLFQFFTYDGYKFKTSAEDLYRAEKAGIKISELLRSKGIEPYSDNFDHSPTVPDKESRQETDARLKEESGQYVALNGVSTDDELRRFAEQISMVKDESYEREQRLVQNLNAKIARQEVLISLLRREVKKYGGDLYTDIGLD